MIRYLQEQYWWYREYHGISHSEALEWLWFDITEEFDGTEFIIAKAFWYGLKTV